MTTILVDERKETLRMELSGHANYGQIGADVVCAGISTLVGAWIQYCYDNDVEIINDDMSDPGYADIYVKDYGRERKAFSVIITGLKLLEKTYPKNVHIIRGEIKKDIF